MPGQVDGHHLVAVREGGQLTAPVTAVARPAVDEHQRRRPRPVDLERQGMPSDERATPRTGCLSLPVMAPPTRADVVGRDVGMEPR